MSLKEKIISILVGVFIIYGIVDYAIQYFIIFPSFLQLEHHEAEQNLQRTVNVIEREIFHLDSLCHDWSSWDDTYDFVESHSQDYIKSNLVTPSLFTNNQINLFYVYDLKGRVVWGEIRDLVTEELIQIPDFPPQDLAENHPLLSHLFDQEKSVEKTGTAGILVTTQGYMLIAARPILTSEEQGPVRGMLVMARILTPQFVEMMVKQTQVDFEILHPKEFPEIPHEVIPVMDENRNELVTIVDKDKNRLLLYKKFTILTTMLLFLLKLKFLEKLLLEV